MKASEILILLICFLISKGSSYISNNNDNYDKPKYSYDYSVNDFSTGDAKSQWETREGDIVQGEYSLVEPDGTVRTVRYISDAFNGFRAIVKRVMPSGKQTTIHY